MLVYIYIYIYIYTYIYVWLLGVSGAEVRLTVSEVVYMYR